MLRVAETTQRTDTGLQRRGNEDSSYARAPVFVVADGMGGAQSGEVASRIVVQTFEQGLPDTGTPAQRLTVRVQEANSAIHQRSRTEHENAGMGTTVTAAMLDGEHIAIAHVGDSRAYMYRAGELKRLTQDHSLVDELVRQGKLTEEQAAEHPQRSIITRALGPEPIVEVDTWSYPARADDLLLLCSDGLTSMISEAQIEELLGSTRRLDKLADALIHAANAAGGRDNITVILFRVEEVGGASELEQPTASSPVASDRARTVSLQPPERVPVAPPPDLNAAAAENAARVALAESSRLPRLARNQTRPRPKTAKPSRLRSERLIKPVSALLATLIVVFLIGSGGYIATRQLYFLGTDANGVVTVYRGLPYDFLGVRLWETFYTSGVPATLVPKDRRSIIFNHHLMSQTAASKLVMNIELGNISK